MKDLVFIYLNILIISNIYADFFLQQNDDNEEEPLNIISTLPIVTHKFRHSHKQYLRQTEGSPCTNEYGNKSHPDFHTCPTERCTVHSSCSSGQRSPNLMSCFCDQYLCGRVCINAKKECEYVSNIQYGNVTKSQYNNPGSVITYACLRGYSLKGSAQRYCTATGKWSGSEPSCVNSRDCSHPPVLENTIHNKQNINRFAAGDDVRYQCKEGYAFQNKRLTYVDLKCVGNDEWTGIRSHCQIVDCGDPGNVTNSRRLFTNEKAGFVYKQKVVYFCLKEYKPVCQQAVIELSSCQVRECKANGRWLSTSDIVCEPLQCSKPVAPEHGQVQGHYQVVNSISSYSCNPGYYLTGSKSRKCLQNETWDGTPANCKLWNCGLPPFVADATFTKNSTNYGGVTVYKCNQNTTLVGESAKVTCGSDGIWIPDPPKCYRHCAPLQIDHGITSFLYKSRFLNANMTSNKFVEHSVKVNVTCEAGYKINRTFLPTCQNGTWVDVPGCVPAPCNVRPPQLLNAIARFYSLEHNAVAQYVCRTGYQFNSAATTVRCQYGQWVREGSDKSEPECCAMTCPRPTSLENGVIMSVGVKAQWIYTDTAAPSKQDDLIRYDCNEGYRLIGLAHAVCMNAEWRPIERPHCQKILHKPLKSRWLFYKKRLPQ